MGQIKWDYSALAPIEEELTRRIRESIDEGRVKMQDEVNVDTGSLRYTIQAEYPSLAQVRRALSLNSAARKIEARLFYGGMDLSKKKIPLTGVRGKRVTYAAAQEKLNIVLTRAMGLYVKQKYNR